MLKQYANLFFLFLWIAAPGCAQQKKIGSSSSSTSIAFPGAEGYGKYARGGRGGKVIIVSNLEDDGPGSFRQAADMKQPRIIVFTVSGTIHLKSKLFIRADATIAGQSSPGDGICLADASVSLAGNNIIVRYLRFRMGDKAQKGGMVDGNGGDDAFGGVGKKNIIIDHCTMSWSTDEAFSVYAGDSTTLQWNLISEPLNYSYHFETGDKDYEHHGYGGIWGGMHLSAHHNLFAHCTSRTPRFNGIRHTPTEFVDFRNNVIYNWGHNNVYAGEGGNYNIINNYYKPGPSTNKNVRARIVNPNDKLPSIPLGKYFVDGNFVVGAPEVTANNYLGIHMDKNATEADKSNLAVKQPFAADAVETQKAKDAYLLVLRHAGASLKRDTLDSRIIRDVENGVGGFIDVQGGFPHGTEYEKTLSAWPYLKSLPAPTDRDSDGMPDNWEEKNGLDPANAADASGTKLHPFYTNIEVYLNSLIK